MTLPGEEQGFSRTDRSAIPSEDIAPIVRAIGNHDEGNGLPVSNIAAALILADNISKLSTTGRKRGYKTLEIPVFMRVLGLQGMAKIIG